MSWFVAFLKHIFGSGDEERKEIPRNQSQSDHDYHRVLNTGYSTPSVNQSSFAQMKSNSVPRRNVVAESCTTAMDPCNKVPVVSSQFGRPSSVEPPSATTKTKMSPISEKSGEVPLKPHILSSSPSADVRRIIKGNQVNSEVTKHGSPYIVISDSSRRSQPSCDLPSYVHPSRPPWITDKPIPSSVLEKFKPTASQKSDAVSDTEKQSPTPTLKKDPPPSTLPQSPKPPPLSTKPTLSPLLSGATSQQENTNYVWVERSGSTTYVFPEDIKSLIEKDIVPGVLKMPLSPSTYKNYFHALLYAEDYHLEKWEGFEVKNVTLELRDATIYARKKNSKSYNDAVDKDEKVFVTFDIDKILEKQSPFDGKHERRPFLLSRDFISVKPTGRKINPFQGVVHRVVKSSIVLAEFGESFHSQHEPECEYDVKFSFNRVCLKRAHHAITAAPDILYWKFVFPDLAPKQEIPPTDLFVNYRYRKEAFAIWQILRLQSAPPYLVEGPLSKHLSSTALVIVEAVLQICQKSPSNRVLLCAPLNNTCDELMLALKKKMDESNMFRANAAFREINDVPEDILPSCRYEEESDCFACPSLEELKKYKVISSTFMSSFRLRDEGMVAGHFSHIFLVDASSVTEPEAMVPIANFVNSETIVVVTGAPRDHSGWVRSKIARQNGLLTSYFERLRKSELYKNLDPRVITRLEDSWQNLNESP